MSRSLRLSPGTVVEDGPLWVVAVNRNQNLLGKCLLMLARLCTAVPELTAAKWTALHRTIGRVTTALTEQRLLDPDDLHHLADAVRGTLRPGTGSPAEA